MQKTPATFRQPGLIRHQIGPWIPSGASAIISSMDRNKTTIERAFEIAAAGTSTGVADLRSQLRAEGYDLWQLQGRSLAGQLRKIILEAKAGANRS